MTLLPSGLVVLSVSPGWAQMLLDQQAAQAGWNR